MKNDIKAYELLNELRKKYQDFDEIITKNITANRIRFFGSAEWNKITSQNYVPLIPGVKDFEDMFIKGYNIGNCMGISYALSFSYNDVDIVSGVLPVLKGTLNAEKKGKHVWLEDSSHIIDSSLMLVIDKSLKSDLGYIEEQRITSYQLARSSNYQTRKEFATDPSIRKGKSR